MEDFKRDDFDIWASQHKKELEELLQIFLKNIKKSESLDLREGAIIKGRRFEFVKVTPDSQQQILKKMYGQVIRRALHRLFFPSRLVQRDVHKFVSIAFVKDTFQWKWLHIIPKEFRTNSLTLKEYGKVKADFFVYYNAEVKECSKQLNSVINLEMGSKPVSPTT